MKIIDASVALKWFVFEEHGQKVADKVLDDIQQQPNAFAVPDLFFAEMLHILCRVMNDKQKVGESLTILESLGIERIGLGHELLETAGRIALTYKLSGYDAIYVATAQLVDGKWFTFDKEAHRKIQKLNLSQLLI